MAFDELLAERIAEILSSLDPPQLVEKRMFGGIGYLVKGNMACGVNQDQLIVRVGPDAYQEVLQQPGTRPFDITGRPMRGWVMVAGDTVTDDEMLEEWVERGVSFALTLPPK